MKWRKFSSINIKLHLIFKISNTIAREGTRQRLGCRNLLRSIFCSLCGQIVARKTDAAIARIPNSFEDL